jgi:hypothetical protein
MFVEYLYNPAILFDNLFIMPNLIQYRFKSSDVEFFIFKKSVFVIFIGTTNFGI